MIIQFLIGIAMTIVSITIGALVIVLGAEQLQARESWLRRGALLQKHVFVLAMMTTWLVFGMIIVMLIWAVALHALGIFTSLEPALYFSMISFTTLGFGDVILPDEWRLLSGFIAMDGFILFGLNTAFLFEALRRLRTDPHR
jgi:hypothetical protein